MGLISVLKWLYGKTSSLYASPFWQMLVWLAFMIDFSGALSGSSSDPLDIPQHRGPMGKAQAVPKAKRWKVARIAAQGKLARSGRAALEILRELRPGFSAENVMTGNKWIQDLVWQYIHKLQRTFKMGACEMVYSLSWDATRMSKRDTLVCCIYNADLDIAAWAPPQVPI